MDCCWGRIGSTDRKRNLTCAICYTMTCTAPPLPIFVHLTCTVSSLTGPSHCHDII